MGGERRLCLVECGVVINRITSREVARWKAKLLSNVSKSADPDFYNFACGYAAAKEDMVAGTSWNSAPYSAVRDAWRREKSASLESIRLAAKYEPEGSGSDG